MKGGMLAKQTPAHAPSQRMIRLAWWLAFAATIVLLAAVSVARSAQAAGPSSPPDPSASILPPFEEGEECEADEPECTEEGEEECEAGDEEECEEAEAEGAEAPAECLLTTARPRLSISDSQQRLRLQLRYTLSGPAEVSIGLRSSGGKGPLTLPASKHRFSHSGTFRESFALSAPETERALDAKQFTVRLHVLDVPSSCHRYDFHHLSVKRGGHDAPAFSEKSS
jgi:hypothetical protein